MIERFDDYKLQVLHTVTFFIEECWGKFSTLTSNLEQRWPCKGQERTKKRRFT